MTHTQRKKRRQAIAKYMQEGHNRAQAAEKFKCSEALIRTACREHGISQTRVVIKDTTLKAIAQMQNTDKTINKIADDIGVSASLINQVKKRAKDAGINFA